MIDKYRLYTVSVETFYHKLKAYAFYGRLVIVDGERYFNHSGYEYTVTCFDTDIDGYMFTAKNAQIVPGKSFSWVADEFNHWIATEELEKVLEKLSALVK